MMVFNKQNTNELPLSFTVSDYCNILTPLFFNAEFSITKPLDSVFPVILVSSQQTYISKLLEKQKIWHPTAFRFSISSVTLYCDKSNKQTVME